MKCVRHRYTAAGTYDVTLSIEDDDALTDSITKQVIVKAPPVANFSFTPSNPTTSDTIFFEDKSYDSDGSIVDWIWNFGDGNVSKGGIGLQFDGIDDYINVPHNSGFDFDSNDFTIEFWIKQNSDTWHQGYLTTKSDGRTEAVGDAGWVIRWYTNHIVFHISDGTNFARVHGKTNIVDGKWHHIVAVREGNILKLYVDGALDETADASLVGSITDGSNIYIGRQTVSGGTYFDGIMDDVRIYNKALTASEIQNNYNGNVVTTGLVSWWKFNEGSGGIAHDSIGSNDGTINGCNWMKCVRHRYTAAGTYDVTLSIEDDDGTSDSITKQIIVT